MVNSTGVGRRDEELSVHQQRGEKKTKSNEGVELKQSRIDKSVLKGVYVFY